MVHLMKSIYARMNDQQKKRTEMDELYQNLFDEYVIIKCSMQIGYSTDKTMKWTERKRKKSYFLISIDLQEKAVHYYSPVFLFS